MLAGEPRRWVDETFGLPEPAALEIGRLTESVGVLAERINLDAPWQSEIRSRGRISGWRHRHWLDESAAYLP